MFNCELEYYLWYVLILDVAEEIVTKIIAETQRCDSQCQTTEPSVVNVAVQTNVYMGYLSNFSTEDLKESARINKKMFMNSVLKYSKSCEFYTGTK